MMKLKCDFSKVKVGDVIFSARNGKVKVIAADSEGFEADFWYDLNGFPLDYHTSFPMAFWSQPEIIIPAPPKRMVKKTLKVTACHKNGVITWVGEASYITEQFRNDYISKGCVIEELSKEIEIEE